MKRNFGVFACTVLTFGFVVYACASGEVVDGPATGTAGSGNPAGTAGTGNTVGTAGTTGGGNQTGHGGTGGGGNQVGTAGTTGSGNTVGTAGRGGTTGAGNTVGTAGTTGTGNTVGTAGTTGAGNSVGTAGTTGTAGSIGTLCPTTFTVSSNGFVQMPAKGGACFSGYPYTYADSYGTMVMPMPMTAFTTAMLKLTGSIVAVSGSMYSYAGIGFSVGQTGSGDPPTLVTPKGTGLTVTFTNGTTGTGVALRFQVTNGTTTWCKDVTTSPATVLYTDFHVSCYNATPGAAYAMEPIKGIELNLAGGTAAGTINLTINSVTEN
jgi:hypothetical protein